MNDADEFDMGAAQAVPEDRLTIIFKEIQKGIELEEWIDQTEAEVSAAKKELQAIRTGRIPDLMAEINLEKCTYAGYDVAVSDFMSGSLPKDPERREAAIKLIEEAYDAAGLIKTSVSIDFGRSEHNEALALVNDLKEEGHNVEVQSGVHPQTLIKFARDRIASGEPIDLEALGLYTGKVAKWKPAKKGSKK